MLAGRIRASQGNQSVRAALNRIRCASNALSIGSADSADSTGTARGSVGATDDSPASASGGEERRERQRASGGSVGSAKSDVLDIASGGGRDDGLEVSLSDPGGEQSAMEGAAAWRISVRDSASRMAEVSQAGSIQDRETGADEGRAFRLSRLSGTRDDERRPLLGPQ